jgi:hypothetical protein
VPGGLLPWVDRLFHDTNGDPLPGGKVDFFATGTSTRKDTFTDAQLTVAHPNPVVLDAEGRATVFLEAGGYDVVIKDANDVVIATIVGVIDLAQTFLAGQGGSGIVAAPFLLTPAELGVTSGTVIAQATNFVTVNSTGGPDPCVITLPPADGRTGGRLLTIKNMGNILVEITPGAGDTIDDQAQAFVLGIINGGRVPGLSLVSDEDNNWWIVSVH